MPLPSEPLSPADAAIVETFVVPRYLALFGELALELLLPGERARIVHLGCRTGYLDHELCGRFPQATLIGVDASAPALELARNKAAARGDIALEYLEVHELPTPLEALHYSHAISLCPDTTPEERADLFNEMAGLLYTGAQALVALPMRGSFQEVNDLWREFSLKHDEGDLGKLIDEVALTRPTVETLSEELEGAGLDDVDVAVRPCTLTFDSGRAFVDDPVTRLFVLPDLRRHLPGRDLSRATEYLRDAIDRYWSEGKFELSVQVGCASARKVD